MKWRDRLFSSPAADRAYGFLVNEEDARVCKGIDESACKVVPGNFLLQLLTQILTKLGDTVANPKTVLAWLMSALGAPGVFTAFLVPIRESGSMVPQLFIAHLVRRWAKRKWAFVVGCLLQALAVFAMALIAWTTSGATAGWLLLLALVGFSLARGLCSIASKDVLGKTVPQSRRGRVSGWAAFFAGWITIVVGVLLLFDLGEPGSMEIYLTLLLVAGSLWLAAAWVYASLDERAGATGGGGHFLEEGWARLRLLSTDGPLRQFVVSRSLLLCSALSAPFFILLAHENTGGQVVVLGLFVIADGLANLFSGPFWGKFADRSSRGVMVASGATAGLVGLILVACVTLVPGLAGNGWVYPIFFFFLAIAHAGVRVGRKTYIVDIAPEGKRTDYVAVSNTVIGVTLLLAGVIGSLATLISVPAVIIVLATMGLGGALLSRWLPEAEHSV